MFNFDYETCIETWDGQWQCICDYLKNNKDQMPKLEKLITDNVFANLITQLVEYKRYFTARPVDISQLFRGVKENKIENVSPQRFIPDWKYVDKDHPNRMNGPDQLYNYFTIGYRDCQKEDLIFTSAQELRLDVDDLFWGCYFVFPEELSRMKFIDLRTRAKIPKDNEHCFKFIRSKATHGLKYTSHIDESEVVYWSIQLILSIWENSKMFAPINDRCSEILWEQYRPFHMLCDYFKRNGFDGVIYRSTVYKKGACLALFNINNAKCIDSTLTQLNSTKYIYNK